MSSINFIFALAQPVGVPKSKTKMRYCNRFLSWMLLSPAASAFLNQAFHPHGKPASFLSSNSKTTSLSAARTLYDKIWDDHLVDDDGMSSLIYVDRHLVHEVTSPQAFEGLKLAGRAVRRPDCVLATVDHNVPTSDRSTLIDVQTFIAETASRTQVMQLEQNVKDFGIKYFGMADERQGIVHIIGPEQGFTLPGTVCVCGDSHTATHGAFGALAFGIGTSEVEHVLASQVRILIFLILFLNNGLPLFEVWRTNLTKSLIIIEFIRHFPKSSPRTC